MRRAPGVLVWNDVLRLGKIRCTRIHRSVQVVNVNKNPVRRNVMSVAAMVVRGRTAEITSERVNPRARTDPGLAAVQTAPVRIGTAGAQMGTAHAIASKTA